MNSLLRACAGATVFTSQATAEADGAGRAEAAADEDERRQQRESEADPRQIRVRVAVGRLERAVPVRVAVEMFRGCAHVVFLVLGRGTWAVGCS